MSLHQESSPYLLQHANNPVDWYPWGEEALAKAKKENKLIVVSIGYSACHWCHVMEHESFEDNEVAEVMNALYVNIKVDREERPDIDQIYMSALQLMNGTGGWPLNCILLPDQRPIYGGTYFKKKDWINILSNVAAMFRNKPEELYAYADKLMEGVQKMEFITASETNAQIPENYLTEYMQNWNRFLDFENGGTIGAPKFPVPCNLQYLLRYNHYFHQDTMEYFLQNTLHRIARGGIYDQVGGGIYRYSVDGVWHIPHFEKMLYDQAQMISLYAEAYTKYRNPLYLKTFERIISFCNRELYNEKEQSYYSALDADSEGVEGKFYCYTNEELRKLMGKDAELFIEYFRCTELGNFEHGLNNLFMITEIGAFLAKHQLSETEWEQRVEACLSILFEYRNKRVRPSLDDKQLCAWNALMVKGLVDAYKASLNENYLVQAENTLRFITSKLLKGTKLFRSFKNDEVKVNAFLDDYAFLIRALLSVYEITSKLEYLTIAQNLAAHCLKEFYDAEHGMFYYTASSSENLVARKQEFYDSVIPSSNAIMQENLQTLSVLTDTSEYEEIADYMMHNMLDNMKRYPPSFSAWATYLLNKTVGNTEMVIIGAEAKEFYQSMLNVYLPGVLILYSTQANDWPMFKNRSIENQTSVYVCKNRACLLPVKTVDEALALLQ
jgi:uncharacterized protein YyaL (SSP411 family)